MAYAKPPYPSHISMPSGSGSNSSPAGTSLTSPNPPESSQHAVEAKEKGNPTMTMSQLLSEAHRFYEAREDLHSNERGLWKQERKAWNNERQHLLQRIRELERNVASLMSDRPVLSPLAQYMGASTGTSTSLNAGQPNQTSQGTSAERAFWIGPESKATRIFPDTIPFQNASQQRRHSIDGNKPPTGIKKSVEFDTTTNAALSRHESLSGVSGESVHPDYSDINFKPSALPSDLRKAVEKVEARGTQDKSVPNTDGSSDSKPQVVVRPKLLDIPTANMQSEELYSIDAGHTPLARVLGSEPATGDRTPMPPTHSQVPVDPQPTVKAVRPPNERQDSYFANAQIDGSTEDNGDRALKGPLGVSAEGGPADTDFLEKVNEKLERQLSQQLDTAGLSPPTEKGHRRGVSEDSDGGPKLRLKPSINFGAPFGQSEPGRM